MSLLQATCLRNLKTDFVGVVALISPWSNTEHNPGEKQTEVINFSLSMESGSKIECVEVYNFFLITHGAEMDQIHSVFYSDPPLTSRWPWNWILGADQKDRGFCSNRAPARPGPHSGQTQIVRIPFKKLSKPKNGAILFEVIQSFTPCYLFLIISAVRINMPSIFCTSNQTKCKAGTSTRDTFIGQYFD